MWHTYAPVPLLISAKSLRKGFGVRPLFDSIDFVVDEGERVGLIGPNGAGKSTLLKIIAGQIDADAGEVSRQRGITIGYLEQIPTLPDAMTVEEAVRAAVPANHHDDADTVTGEWLSRLELTEFSEKAVETLSGGWKKRVALARELVKGPHLLLLDEPTNHLDVESILWLEEFLAVTKIATVTITHDRAFLQKVSNRILDLDPRNPGGLLSVPGDYFTYLDRKEELLQNQLRTEVILKNTLRRETEWLRRGAKARSTKQQARIHSAEALIKTVSELETRNQHRVTRLSFESTDKKPKRIIEGNAMSKSYGGQPLFSDVEVFLGPGSRLGLLGRNGCGKSTLIRILLGQEQPDRGKVFRTDHLKVAYFEQNRDSLNPNETLRRTLCPHGDEVNFRGRMVHIHGYLDRFLFKKEQREVLVGRLSGGEQARVLLARLMLQEANVLVLDEPTNDLDLETLDVLQNVLVEFEGAVILVTHDRFFLDQTATQILAFFDRPEGGSKVVAFADLSQWEDWREARRREKKEAAKVDSRAASSSGGKKKMSFNDSRELAGMDVKIQATEAKLEKLQADLNAPENQSNGAKLAELCAEAAKVQNEVDRLYARWSQLEAMK